MDCDPGNPKFPVFHEYNPFSDNSPAGSAFLIHGTSFALIMGSSAFRRCQNQKPNTRRKAPWRPI